MTSPRVVLTGPPGAGKSTVMRALGQLLALPYRDTDLDIERLAGKQISEIFVDDGEAHFRSLEVAAVSQALSEHGGVLALGGGAIMDPHTQALLTQYTMQGGTLVFLDVSLSAAAPRVGFNQSRPLLLGNPRSRWKQLMDLRRPTYERLATMQVLTDNKTPETIAQEISDHLTGKAREL